MDQAPVLYWMRRDFRLADNPALAAAAESGAPVIPVFICDPLVEALGAAPAWRLGLAVKRFAETLGAQGSRLILRRGNALQVLQTLIEETGAQAVYWGRLYDPETRARDTEIKSALKATGVEAVSHPGHVLHEPWTVETQTGQFYKVYSPFWRAVKDRELGPLLPVPTLVAPEHWPESDDLAEWGLGAGMNRGAGIVRPHLTLGEAAARARWDQFLETKIDSYQAARDFLDQDACSGLSEPLAYGEISARVCWHAAWEAMRLGADGAEHFLKELTWRDFAYHLIYHSPEIVSTNWRDGWDSFPWQMDADAPEVIAWQRGRTGVPVIDAAMRELYVTGRMHNRARMLVASYLTKHLMTHWRIGMDWFAECLVDWDPASNAMGWQWVAGSGPDAAPYFRIFNPETQAERFDPDGVYHKRWVAELSDDPGPEALSFFQAIPKSWGMSPGDPYPEVPIMGLAEGRARALLAYENR